MNGLTPYQQSLLRSGRQEVAALAKPGVEYVRRSPLLRSLPLAKACAHNNGVNGTTKAGCGACTTYGCRIKGTVKLSDCVYCPDFLENPKVSTEYSSSRAGYTWREPIHFNQHNLPGPPGLRFNPSIIESGDGYLFVYRTGWAGSQIYAVRLDKTFQPVGESTLLNLNRSGCGYGKEDPRLFRLNGKLHMMYVGVIGKRGPTNSLFCRINEDTLEVEDRFFPQGFPRQSWEKSHSYFDYQGVAHAVYSINPHKILRVEGDRGQFVHETPFPGSWSGGYMRGGASPVLHNGEWYHFFHGKWDNHRIRSAGQSTECQRRHVYNFGCYTFSPEPPFNILRYTPHPIEVAPPDMTDGNYCDVEYPGGVVLVDGQWVMALGINDRRAQIRFYPEGWVESQLVDVCPSSSG